VAWSHWSLRTRLKLLVLRPGVLVLRNGHRLAQLGEVVEARERLPGVEDDRVRVGGLDRRVGVGVRRLVRTLVAGGQVEDRLEVRRAVREGRLVRGTQHRVLHVGGRDLLPVLVLHALAQLVGPGLPVLARLAEAFGEVGHQLVAGRARRHLEGEQRTAVETREVPGVAVVGLARVEGVPVAGVGELQRAALGFGGVDHAVEPGVEGGGVAAAARALRGRASPATGGEQQRAGGAGGDERVQPPGLSLSHSVLTL
jgi:hypothetical protein